MLVGQPSVHRALVQNEMKEAAETPSKKRKRDYSDDLIKRVTDDARQFGPAAAQRKHSQVHYATCPWALSSDFCRSHWAQ